jgi:hypothetical protein
LVVQDALGGSLLRTRVDGRSHYFNRLADGSVVDLTIEQFGPGSVAEPSEARERAYVLSFPDTEHRYQLLRDRVLSALVASRSTPFETRLLVSR